MITRVMLANIDAILKFWKNLLNITRYQISKLYALLFKKDYLKSYIKFLSSYHIKWLLYHVCDFYCTWFHNLNNLSRGLLEAAVLWFQKLFKFFLLVSMATKVLHKMESLLTTDSRGSQNLTMTCAQVSLKEIWILLCEGFFVSCMSSTGIFHSYNN